MEAEMPRVRFPCDCHKRHHLSSIEKRLENLFGCFRESFQGELSLQKLGPRFGCYGTFLPVQLNKSQASNYAATENHIQAQLKSLPGRLSRNSLPDTAKMPTEPVRSTLPYKLAGTTNSKHMPPPRLPSSHQKNATKITIKVSKKSTDLKLKENNGVRKSTKEELYKSLSLDLYPNSSPDTGQHESISCASQISSVESEESPNRILELMRSCPLSSKPIISPLKRKISDFVVKRQAVVRAAKEKLASPRARHKLKIKIPNRSTIKDVQSSGNSKGLEAKNAALGISMEHHDEIILDNWVQCDKCLKWRLLPYWIDPSELPIKWSCSNINWLGPGMNNCKISIDDYEVAVNKRCPGPLSSPARKPPLTKRPSEEILDSEFCRKKKKIQHVKKLR